MSPCTSLFVNVSIIDIHKPFGLDRHLKRHDYTHYPFIKDGLENHRS
jgi:hypothetical protein